MSRMLPAVLLSLLPSAVPAHAPSAPGRLAEVEIVEARSGRVLPTYRHEGRLHVVGEPGREYTIRIRNRDGGRVLAVTSVDGVNVISGQTADVRQGGYVLDAWGVVDIAGWRKSLDRVARFYFTDLGDSYAARTGRPDDVGVIGVALFRERERPQGPWRSDDSLHDRDAAEERAGAPSAKAQRAEPRLGTGHGASQWSQARYTDFERASDSPDEVITIGYDSRRNLLAQGVIPRARHRPWHRPDPFPAGFVPDP